ncbi:CHAT domain-containing protein [Roseateles puraquae]|uniref:CHAT domain-containing protein n=1 Tax=Roseateles puraquae TaxID=431059 RepID=A0A254NFC2_9BURK|nr:CHAT domain-containing protein [Roseateles puraquae]MDG0852217.1 CHAT domain-containing protein [Roseateles puraquae]OWR04078.1 hypothetical protein CDO81_10170 [Roseateles puraquae]
MLFEFPADLPSYIDSDRAKLLSIDGQIYTRCVKCGEEMRCPPEFDAPTRCAACGAPEACQPVVHSRRVSLKCLDNGHVAQVRTSDPGLIACPQCRSGRTTLDEKGIDPPFPTHFFDVLDGYEYGNDVSADANRLLEELQHQNAHPDFQTAMLLMLRFVGRLRKVSYAADPAARCILLNIEGNLYRDYFRRTFVVPAALKSLSRFEEAAALSDHAFSRAAIEHNYAMAAYSALAKLKSEQLVKTLAGFDVRAAGLAAAHRALAGYAGEEFSTRDRELARTHHLLGDLHAVGDPKLCDFDEANRHYAQALQFAGGNGTLSINIAVSRVNALAKQGWPEGAASDQAAKDLEYMLRTPEVGRIWPQQHEPHHYLASYLLRHGRLDEAIREWELAAALAQSDIDRALEEHNLYGRVHEYLPIFSALAAAYARRDEPLKALAATEALRGATIRLHTMSEEERRRQVERVLKAQFEQMLGVSRDTPHTKQLRLPDIEPMLATLGTTVPGAALVSLDVHAGVANLFLDPLKPKKFWSGRKIAHRTWRFDSPGARKVLDKLTDYRQDMSKPGINRNRALTEFFRELDPIVFEPMRKLLQEEGVNDVLLVTPGLLNGLPFDVAAGSATAQQPARSRHRVRQLPSLAVAHDICLRQRNRNGRLLIVGYEGDDLPRVADEVQTLRDAFRENAVVVPDRRLTKVDVLAELAKGYEYIHFCCHGTFDHLFPERSALLLSADHESDAKRVTAKELREVGLQGASLVTLSACSSNLGSFQSTNDLFGLTGSLLRSGARAVVGSRWPVSDAFAGRFMGELYTRIAQHQVDPVVAFDEVCRAASSSEKLENWASFSFVGI